MKKLICKKNEVDVFILHEGIWRVDEGLVQRTQINQFDDSYIGINLYSPGDYIFVNELNDDERFKVIESSVINQVSGDQVEIEHLLKQLDHTEKLVYLLGHPTLPGKAGRCASEDLFSDMAPKGRVMLLIEWLNNKLGRSDAATLFSQEQIASFCSITRVTVNKYLRYLKKTGHVDQYRYTRTKVK